MSFWHEEFKLAFDDYIQFFKENLQNQKYIIQKFQKFLKDMDLFENNDETQNNNENEDNDKKSDDNQENQKKIKMAIKKSKKPRTKTKE